ncbi:flagellin [Arcobacter sp.]|uniref:flagellin n=1 Tax=Arcobacter sp. TaxID=1872629 RepID=UPI003D14B243
MEIGRIPEIDVAKANHEIKIKKVQEVDEKDRIVPDEKYKNVKPNEQTNSINEVVLDNVKFGYNKESKDFFVKVTRGDAEFKYPTEDMMKVKAHLNELIEDLNKK